MNMNTAFFLRPEQRSPRWHVIDVEGKVLGRVATKIADMLRGKDKPCFAPQVDAGDYVVVLNCTKVVLTGDKMENKEYTKFSGYRGGLKKETARVVMQKDPERIIREAVKGMLPKNKLSARLILKLKIYEGDQHPHAAQVASSK